MPQILCSKLLPEKKLRDRVNSTTGLLNGGESIGFKRGLFLVWPTRIHLKPDTKKKEHAGNLWNCKRRKNEEHFNCDG
jgi:hypothetical protein